MDAELLRIIDNSLAEAARRSGAWLACRRGCSQCCLGPFEITQLDARRLRLGFAELAERDPARAAAVQERTRHAGPDDDSPCPALDPETGACDLYEARPMICRVFGPAVRDGDAIGACELCYEGATDQEIAACAVEMDPEGLESALDAQWERESGLTGPATVAACLGAPRNNREPPAV